MEYRLRLPKHKTVSLTSDYQKTPAKVNTDRLIQYFTEETTTAIRHLANQNSEMVQLAEEYSNFDSPEVPLREQAETSDLAIVSAAYVVSKKLVVNRRTRYLLEQLADLELISCMPFRTTLQSDA